MNTVVNTNVVVDPSVQRLIDRVRKAERSLAGAYGPFTLFGLFEREDTPERWDLIASAPWLSTGREGIKTIATYLTLIATEEAVQIGRIVPLAPESHFTQAMLQIASVVNEGFISTGQMILGGAEFSRAYILVAQKGRPLYQPIGMRG